MYPRLKPPVKKHGLGRYIFTRPVYKVWWLTPHSGVVEKYVVADNRAMAIRKAKKAWASARATSVGASILYKKGHITGFYGPANVDLR